jgi:AraC-like DNA-binding protein
MNIKKFTSLTMLLTMLIMTYTGIVLFITPPGRVAYWANWELLGLNKEQYGQIHSTFMLLFVIATILHVYYNWKPLVSYMKNSAKELIIFTKEMIAATVLVLVVLIGTLYEISPFSTFLNFGESVKESWEKDLGTAPYSHAELSSLKNFCSKMGYDLDKSQNLLSQNGIKFELSQSLSNIASENHISPKKIYDILKQEFQKSTSKYIEISGLGKKSIKNVALLIGISPQEFLSQLKAHGIDANENDNIKEAIEKHGKSPMDIMVKLGYKRE